WTDNSGAESGYEVRRSTDGGTTFGLLTTLAAGATGYSDTSVVEDSAYVYQVRAISTNANSDYSANASATTSLNAPTIDPSVIAGSTTVRAFWSDNSSAETGFAIFRSGDGGTTYTQIGTAAADAFF